MYTNDFVRINGSQGAYTVTSMGEGDDTYILCGMLDADFGAAQTDDSARAYVFTEEGDDSVTIKATVDGGRIFTGAGSDTVVIHGEVDDGGVIDLGSGDTTYADGHAEATSADSSDDVNSLHITGSLGESCDSDFGMVIGGAGKDNVVIDCEIEGISSVNLGDNDDSVSVAYMQHNSSIITGNDDDCVTVKCDLWDNTSINTAGEYIAAEDGLIIENTVIIPPVEGRSDDDVVKIGGSMYGTSSVDVGDGTNFISIGGDVDCNSSISAGEHDDTLVIGDDTEDCASIDLGNGNNSISVASTVEDRSSIVTGNGDDCLSIGYAITDFASVNLGDGNNTITLGDDVDGYSTITTGNGDDTLNIGDDTEDGSSINLGNGNNVIHVADTMEDTSSLVTGNGDDCLTVGYATTDFASVNLGNGNNSISIGDDIDGYSTITTGCGNDTLTVGDDTEDGSVTNLGAGNDTMTVADDLEDCSSIIMGNGDDSLTVGGSAYDSASVDMGNGDDTVTFGDWIYCDADIAAGCGDDTLVMAYDDSSWQVSAWQHVTGVSTENISGFETIVLDGINAVDVRFSDLLNDTSRDGALFIQGGCEDKVDLGSTNWNSDSEWQASMRDVTGGTWSQTGCETVDGTTYNVYHNSCAIDASNDVYVEQGVAVI